MSTIKETTGRVRSKPQLSEVLMLDSELLRKGINPKHLLSDKFFCCDTALAFKFERRLKLTGVSAWQ